MKLIAPPGSADSSPSGMFVALWAAAQEWTSSDRANALSPGVAFKEAVMNALAMRRADDVYRALRDVLAMPASSQASFRGQILATMHQIDRAFYSVHPRAASLAPSISARTLLPDWLMDAREIRQLTGNYFASDELRLIARGPLCRPSRHPTAANAETLADRFMALEVVPTQLSHSGRQITVAHKFVPGDAARGIEPISKPGHETVAFLPVAEETHDIVKSEIVRGDQSFVDFRAAPGLNPAARIVEALARAGVVDVAIAPELIISEDDADRLSDNLLEEDCGPRILISGSGPTRARKDEQPWNEARIVNGFGTELWRQQKIWPAGITRELAVAYGLSDPGEGQILEDTAAGDHITVVDADGLGRCIVLICQDLQARPFTDDLLRQYQPDWVFIPVMDYGVEIGRWAHRRAAELSGLSQARFLVASSLTLARWLNFEEMPACGLAVGPASPAAMDGGTAADNERAVATAHIDPMKTGFATLTWRSGGWKKTVVTAE